MGARSLFKSTQRDINPGVEERREGRSLLPVSGVGAGAELTPGKMKLVLLSILLGLCWESVMSGPRSPFPDFEDSMIIGPWYLMGIASYETIRMVTLLEPFIKIEDGIMQISIAHNKNGKCVTYLFEAEKTSVPTKFQSLGNYKIYVRKANPSSYAIFYIVLENQYETFPMMVYLSRTPEYSNKGFDIFRNEAYAEKLFKFHLFNHPGLCDTKNESNEVILQENFLSLLREEQ
ncbi:uncharacterized protein LOC119946436 [Tachyglossus aculeatus]|uniref:uncharacterized protein LOC119946436 n=1 Tax=Tachyglossus aculeatus TaxID=9261 RepID=UPI0018F688FA|nr:uncharacterized protein LOC119946436 [Tachyglossus aculeatus]